MPLVLALQSYLFICVVVAKMAAHRYVVFMRINRMLRVQCTRVKANLSTTKTKKEKNEKSYAFGRRGRCVISFYFERDLRRYESVVVVVVVAVFV